MNWSFFWRCAWHGLSQGILTVVATVTGAMVAQGNVVMPSRPVWLLAGLMGIATAVKGVQGYLVAPNGGR